MPLPRLTRLASAAHRRLGAPASESCRYSGAVAPPRQGAPLVQTKGPTLRVRGTQRERDRESVFVSTSTGANVKRFPLFSIIENNRKAHVDLQFFFFFFLRLNI